MEVSIEELETIESELENCINEIELTKIHIIEIQKRVLYLKDLIQEEKPAK